MMSPVYKAQVDLLLQVLPYVAKKEIFALKGGTAINLFIRKMPRLSVDIDLTYLPLDYKPISELHFPILKDQKSAFDNQFAGMTSFEFSYDDYETTRALLIKTIGERLTDEDKRFLLSFESGDPDWELFPLTVLKDLPAIQWKLLNINKLKKGNAKKHVQMVAHLKEVLDFK